jgi:DNA-binding MarR family transcriptional regulator
LKITKSRYAPNKDSTQVILRHWREAVPNDRMGHLVKDATRALVRALQLRLTEYCVSFGHWAFLRVLWETDGLTQRELSVQVGVMEPTTFSALKSMEKLGMIVRKRVPHHKKKVFIHLTRKGKLLKGKLVPLAVEATNVALRGVPPQDIAATRRTLLTIIENLAYDERESQNKQRRIRSNRELASLIESAGKRS